MDAIKHSKSLHGPVHGLVRTIGEHRGAPRLFIDSLLLLKTGFQVGASFDLQVDLVALRLELVLSDVGQRKISRRQRGGQVMPVIDINSVQALGAFGAGMVAQIELSQERLLIRPLASELCRMRRLQRLALARMYGRFSSLSLAHGIGVMSQAAHEGFACVGADLSLKAAVEIEERWLEHASHRNSAWSSSTMALAMPLQQVAQDDGVLASIGPVDLLEAGLPCSGASRAGKARRGHGRMEEHPAVGHLVAPAISILQRTQPIAFVLENVPSYAHEASASILRGCLADMGYTVHEIELDASIFAAVELRVRWFLVAVTRGIEIDLQVALDTYRRTHTHVTKYVGQLIDEVADNDPMWRSFAYIDAKALRDVRDGKGFAPQLVSMDSVDVPTLRKGYQKAGSTDPLLVHPRNPTLRRQFTVAEHARFKGVPPDLIAGMGFTEGHQALGQSVAYEPVAWLFSVLAKALMATSRQPSTHREPDAIRGRASISA